MLEKGLRLSLMVHTFSVDDLYWKVIDCAALYHVIRL